MRLGSLRLRLVAGGIIAILVALTIAGAGLILLFERHVTRTMADDLDVHLKQLVAGVDVDQDGNLVMTRAPADPRFADALSGLYWQVADDRGQLLRSRSLWDTTLSLPVDEPAPGEVHHHEVTGPADSHVLIAERRVLLTVGDRRVPVRLAVAADLARVATAAAAFAKDIAVALGLLGLVLAIATSIQVGLGLRPLDALAPWRCRYPIGASPSSAGRGAGRGAAAGRGGQRAARRPGAGDRAFAQPSGRSRPWAQDAAGSARCRCRPAARPPGPGCAPPAAAGRPAPAPASLSAQPTPDTAAW